MDKTIFKGQPYRLSLETATNMAGAEELEIEYRKPDATAGAWTATGSGTTVYRDIPGDENDQAGVWRFRARVKFDPAENWTPGTDAPVQIHDYAPVP